MKVTLSGGSIAAIAIVVVIVGVLAGLYHDASIKAVYASFDGQVSQLDGQISQLQSQTKFAFVHGSISKYGGSPTDIFFDGPNGVSLSSAVTQDSTSFQYQYQIYLKSGVTYGVRIDYQGGVFSSRGSCAGIPVTITPSGLDYSQNFTC